MEILSQSTFLPLDASLALKVLEQSPKSFPLGRNTPTLLYLSRQGLKLGAVVDCELHFGIHRIEWKTVVSQFSAKDLSFELKLIEPNFLIDFHSSHQVLPFGNGACILREKMSFRSKELGIQSIIRQSSFMHAIRERMTQCGLAVSDSQQTAYGLEAVSELG